MDDEQGREGRVSVLDVESEGPAVKLLEIGRLGEVDEHELAALAAMYTRCNSHTDSNLHRAYSVRKTYAC